MKSKSPEEKPEKPVKEKRDSPGQPTKLTPELQQRFVAHMLAGNYLETAARLCRVNPSTARGWITKGQSDAPEDEIYRQFLAAVDEAEAQAEDRLVKGIDAFGGDDWKALAWRLERRHQKRWGYKQTTEHSGPDGSPISVNSTVHVRKTAADLTDDELAEIIEHGRQRQAALAEPEAPESSKPKPKRSK